MRANSDPVQLITAGVLPAGLTLTADGDRRRYKSPVPLTPVQIEFLRQRKAELLALLSPPDGTPPEPRTTAWSVTRPPPAREEAERPVRPAMRVFQYRVADNPTGWLTLIAPGCDLEEARRIVTAQFGAERVLEVQPYEWRSQ